MDAITLWSIRAVGFIVMFLGVTCWRGGYTGALLIREQGYNALTAGMEVVKRSLLGKLGYQQVVFTVLFYGATAWVYWGIFFGFLHTD